jgi:biotin carboxylase
LGNKALFAAYLLTNSFAAYLPILYGSEEAVQYPCVVKSLEFDGGSGIELVCDRSTLNQIIQNKEAHAEPFIVQAFISGEQEFVTHAILREGQILWHQTFCYYLGQEPVIRTATMTNTLETNRVLTPLSFLRVFTQIAQDINLSGPINIDYKMVENHPYLFELNPRLGGSLMRTENTDLLSAALSVIVTQAVASG